MWYALVMKVLTITDVRRNFATVVDDVIDTEEPVAIGRPGGKAVIIVPLDEWESMRETLVVLGTRANTKALMESLDQVDRGEFVEYAKPESDDKTAAA